MSVWDFMLPHHCKLDLNYKIANKEKTLSPSSRIPKVKTLASYYFWRSPVSMTMISFLNPKKCQATNPQCTIPISPSMFHVRNHGVEITTGTRIAGAITSTTHFWGHKEGTLRKKGKMHMTTWSHKNLFLSSTSANLPSSFPSHQKGDYLLQGLVKRDT